MISLNTTGVTEGVFYLKLKTFPSPTPALLQNHPWINEGLSYMALTWLLLMLAVPKGGTPNSSFSTPVEGRHNNSISTPSLFPPNTFFPPEQGLKHSVTSI